MLTKPDEHETDRAGKRLLRETLEPLGWVVNDVQEDYGIDSNVQVFDAKSPTGAWFHVQLKSSASPAYSADHTFISQELSIDHARHYALEMRDPVFLIHADVTSKTVYWYAPQLDRRHCGVLTKTGAKFITARIPICQELPGTAPALLTSLDDIYLELANRKLTSTSTRSFADSLKHLPDQEALYKAFQEKNDTIKLQKICELFRQRKFDQARPRAEALLADPDSTVEMKFWARIQLEGVDYAETLHAGKPQAELPKVILVHAKALQELTASGPKYLKFYSLIARKAAELDVLTHESSTVFMALHQHLEHRGNPMLALDLYARRSALTKRITSKYNQCIRLTRYARNYPDRWVLGRALTNIVRAAARYLITLHAERNFEAEQAFAESTLRICKLAAWICNETGDPEGTVLAVIAALMTTRSTDSDAYRWAFSVAGSLSDPEIQADALYRIERASKRWKGESVEGDYHGDTAWQIMQNVASAMGIDLSDENDPLVRGLRIAARDDSPERILRHCEHILVSLGATGPTARRIEHLFNISTAGSKVVHCTLHDFHVEAKDQDTAYDEFRRLHCDSCPDQKPRPEGWHYVGEVRQTIEAHNHGFVARLAGTPHGLRYTDKD